PTCTVCQRWPMRAQRRRRFGQRMRRLNVISADPAYGRRIGDGLAAQSLAQPERPVEARVQTGVPQAAQAEEPLPAVEQAIVVEVVADDAVAEAGEEDDQRDRRLQG